MFKFVPKNKIRHAPVIFLFKQVITWLFGLLVVEKNLIEYPFRLYFKKAYKGSFCFEYFFLPCI
ncbi:CBO0543 family protein [Neobacillus vireti]|uniref:CBO0543 family protein n=1 Tax=Neobacillus vireti TaxID=220686 RepID=UPI002FFE3944